MKVYQFFFAVILAAFASVASAGTPNIDGIFCPEGSVYGTSNAGVVPFGEPGFAWFCTDGIYRQVACDGSITVVATGALPAHLYTVGGGLTCGKKPQVAGECPRGGYFSTSNSHVSDFGNAGYYWQCSTGESYQIDCRGTISLIGTGWEIPLYVYEWGGGVVCK